MKVLVADDDPTTVLYLTEGLRGSGFEVETAADAMQAVMRAVRSGPDVILLDIKMPGGTGITALQRIRASEKSRNIPVIAMTGSASAEVRREVVTLGAVACLEKPIDLGELVVSLTRLVEERRG